MISKSRYLLSQNYNIKHNKLPFVKSIVTEYFTYISECKSIKYQMVDDDYFKVTIFHNAENRVKKIDRNKYQKKVSKSISHIVNSRIFSYENGIEIICYDKNLDGLKILIAKDDMDLSEYLSFIDDDISRKRNFSETSLALYGNPLRDDKNIYKLMKKIKKVENIDMKSIISKDISIDSAVRVRLYELFLKLEKNSLKILKDDTNRANNLTSYRRKLNTVINILKEYSKYFDEELVEKVKENLKYILSKTDVVLELNSIKSNFSFYQKCLDSESFMQFLKNKDADITDKVEKFSTFMQTREYSIILKQLELLIKESSVELAEDSNLTAKRAVKKSIKKGYKKLNKVIKKDFDCDTKESYEKIYRRIVRLKNINNEFGFLYKNKIFYNRKKLITEVEDGMEKLLDSINNIDISKSFIKDADKVDCLINRFEKNKLKTLKKLKKSISILKKDSDFFIS